MAGDAPAGTPSLHVALAVPAVPAGPAALVLVAVAQCRFACRIGGYGFLGVAAAFD